MAFCETSEQRKQKWLTERRGRIADGLSSFQNRERLSQKQIAAALGSNDKVIAKLLHGENVRLDVDTFLLALNTAGLMIVPVKPDKGEVLKV